MKFEKIKKEIKDIYKIKKLVPLGCYLVYLGNNILENN